MTVLLFGQPVLRKPKRYTQMLIILNKNHAGKRISYLKEKVVSFLLNLNKMIKAYRNNKFG